MTRLIVVLSLILAAPPAAMADSRKVFLNGLDLTNVEVGSHEFKSCTVRFDKDGNVHITAPGFEVKTTEKGKGKVERTGPNVRKRYYLVNKGMAAGKVQFDVTIYINDKKVRTVRSGTRDGVVEVTDHLRPGKNRVKLVARKNLGKDKTRKSYSPKDEIEISLGAGTPKGGVVTIRKTLLSYERNASETGRFSDAFSVEAQ